MMHESTMGNILETFGVGKSSSFKAAFSLFSLEAGASLGSVTSLGWGGF